MRMLVEIEGTTYALKDCVWVGRNPAGHVIRMMSGDAATTTQAAHKEFVSDFRQLEREVRHGHTFTLTPPGDVLTAAYRCLRDQCQHVGHLANDVEGA